MTNVNFSLARSATPEKASFTALKTFTGTITIFEEVFETKVEKDLRRRGLLIRLDFLVTCPESLTTAGIDCISE